VEPFVKIKSQVGTVLSALGIKANPIDYMTSFNLWQRLAEQVKRQGETRSV
jgi:hypothetical protein